MESEIVGHQRFTYGDILQRMFDILDMTGSYDMGINYPNVSVHIGLQQITFNMMDCRTAQHISLSITYIGNDVITCVTPGLTFYNSKSDVFDLTSESIFAKQTINEAMTQFMTIPEKESYEMAPPHMYTTVKMVIDDVIEHSMSRIKDSGEVPAIFSVTDGMITVIPLSPEHSYINANFMIIITLFNGDSSIILCSKDHIQISKVIKGNHEDKIPRVNIQLNLTITDDIMDQFHEIKMLVELINSNL